MGLVRTWISAFGAIVIIVFCWLVVIPTYSQTKSALDNSIANGLYGAAKQTYDTLNLYAGNILNYLPILSILAIIIWAFLNSQRKERYTGKYRL